MTDQYTPNFSLPLPVASNPLHDDVERIRDALSLIDSAIAGRATQADIHAAIDALAGAAPGLLDTLQELAAALGNDPNFAATMASQLAGKMPIDRVASASVLGGVKIGNGIEIDGSGAISVAVSAQAFSEVSLPVSSVGQTVFAVPGGYTAGAVQIHLNGIELVGNGGDYIATNGTSITLIEGADVGDTLILRRWNTFQVADAVRVSDQATQAEMESGTEANVRSMSPLRVKQAIQANAPVPHLSFMAIGVI